VGGFVPRARETLFAGEKGINAALKCLDAPSTFESAFHIAGLSGNLRSRAFLPLENGFCIAKTAA
jgi:hypothetical protein